MGVAGVLGVLLRPGIAALWATVLGPWAGFAVGHADCTMGSQLPGWSHASWISGLVLCVLAGGRRGSPPRPWIPWALGAWSVNWSALAVLSLVNSTS